MIKRIFITALAMLAAACSFTEARDLAEAEVRRFHEQVNAGEHQRLYDAASPELKRITSQEEFLALLGMISERMGAVRETTRDSWNVDYNNGVSQVRLGYDTRFERGSAREEFTYRIEGDRAILVSYRINSGGEGQAAPGNTV